jgi:hypothetical protein
MRDIQRLTDTAEAEIGVQTRQDVTWKVRTRAELYYHKHWKNPDGSLNAPDFVTESTGNLLVRGGASVIWECLKGSGSTASTAAKKYFNATAAIGVGNSTAAAAATQVALQGGSQSLKALTGGFPTHTTGSTAAGVVDIVYKSTWGLTEGNFAWNEWGVFNKATTTQRRMLNRKVQALLTKTSAASATLTVTLSLA